MFTITSRKSIPTLMIKNNQNPAEALLPKNGAKNRTQPGARELPSSKIEEELSKFEKMAAQWWDEKGPFRPLHRLNPVRLDYIMKQWQQHTKAQQTKDIFKGKKLLDIGCGGGLLSVALHGLGADVLGIDAEETTVGVAQSYQSSHNLVKGLRFALATAEELLHDKKYHQAFDMVLAMEVIEHVANPEDFVAAIKKLVKPDGLVIFSTINRNFLAFGLAIVGAEYILKLLPKGTHQYKQFVKPEELAAYCRAAGLRPIDLTGLLYNPLFDKVSLSKKNFRVNYFLTSSS